MEGIGFVSAGELQCGDILRLADGRNISVKQKGFEYLEEPVLVYNLEVEDFHTYYVSGSGVLVHNMCMVESGGKTNWEAHNVVNYAPGKAIGGDVFANTNGTYDHYNTVFQIFP